MGIERSVTRWYVQQQIILSEMLLLEAQLKNMPLFNEQDDNAVYVMNTKLLLHLGRACEKLSSLGPSPKPMMG
jgi:hypothetical protein